ncbi:MAG: hypothetical protein C0475_06365 [Planctomyces sp.]|nr:hypothetical protein [Planctomyces sp.]MBA4039548.1 hypothetical protein [Planctomyces sp.]
MEWWWLGAVVVTAAAPVAWGVSLLTLPGVWLLLLVSAGTKLVVGWALGAQLISWQTLALCAGLAALSECLELIVSAATARRAGASRAGMLGATIGGIVGAIVMAPLLFPVTAVIGGVAGAGAGAYLAEAGVARAEPSVRRRVALAAAVGQSLAVVLKLGTCVGVSVALVVAAWR